jgi:hypothetical protein
VATALPVPAVIPEISIPTVDTSVWGAALWRILHTASVFTKDRNHIQLWRNLLAALKTGIPCPDCSAHYNDWVSQQGLRFSMIGDGIRGPILRWILNLHNDVNRRTGSVWGTWTIKQVTDTYVDLAGAKATLDTLQGIIGPAAWDAAQALLNSL